MTSPIIEISELSKRYGSFRAVDGISLTVEPGEIVALLGPNGAGKTTTIRMLMGILEPSSGLARIRGHDCFADRAEVQRHVGYLPDDPVFYDYLRGIEVIEFVGEMHGLERGVVRERTTELVERLVIDDALDEFAMNYSKGMKKKLSLVCALLHRPALLILDEPTSALDPLATRTVQELIRELAGGGTAIFYSTHILDQAEKLCERVGIMNRGQLAALGPVQELRDRLAPGGSLEDVFFEVAGGDEAKE